MLTDGFFDLLGAAFRREPMVERRWFIAVGTGKVAWDRRPPRMTRGVERLHKEVARKEVRPCGIVFRTPAGDPTKTPTPRIVLSAVFDEDEAVGPLRECGLFGGDATGTAGSGTLTSYFVHGRLDKTLGMVLERTVEVDLSPGSSSGPRGAAGGPSPVPSSP